MDINKIIFVPSIQHTGTWFIINFLNNFFPNVYETKSVILENVIVIKNSILTCHFPINEDIQENKKSLSIGGIKTISGIFKSVIPVRDPFASILTRECRHPKLRHFYIVDGFIDLAKHFNNHPNVKFFPIDLYKDEENRRNLLIDTMVHCGVNTVPHHDLINDIAKTWKPENETPKNRYKHLYEHKDIGQIRFLLGPKWAEIEYLKNNASIILPFLSELGYTKEDLDLW
jgi:hypothetical protein